MIRGQQGASLPGQHFGQAAAHLNDLQRCGALRAFRLSGPRGRAEA